jgi:SAM-dependent methyltransferase
MGAYALVVAALLADLPWGLVAAAVYSAVPYLIFSGGPISPRDLHRAALLRLVQAPWSWWQTYAERPSPSERHREAAREQARDWYQAEYACGVERFLGPSRDDCPWCGSIAVSRYVTSGDIVQIKAGRFTLERCRDCGHVFQNPRLNAAGLDFYYRDFYDGIGADSTGRMFARQGRYYRSRADLVGRHLTPRTWLDVGTGHGHFCRTAGTLLPQTAFDGLDQGDGVGEGARRGWLRHAYQGQFPHLMDELFDRYDVVSMHHYLEHTLDPLAELDAAAKILGPGGHLLIELPDPESLIGRAFGRFWVSWLQPQHLHMIPIGNLEEALASRGLRVVARQRRASHQRYDVLFLVLLLLRTFGPDADRPWAPHPPGLRDRALRALAIGCAVPLVPLAILLDRLVVPLIPGTSNAYRVLARKDEG